MGEDRSLGLESGGMSSGWSDPLGDTTVRPRQGVLGVQEAGQGWGISTKVDEERHEPECTAQATVEGGGGHNQGRHEAVQSVGYIHREEQGKRGWGGQWRPAV